MAREKKSYSVSSKKLTITADVASLKKEDLEVVKNYIALGYKLVNKKIKSSKSIEEMRKELEADKEALEAFNKAYEEKTKKAKKGEKIPFKETGFGKACKIYNEWKKNNK